MTALISLNVSAITITIFTNNEVIAKRYSDRGKELKIYPLTVVEIHPSPEVHLHDDLPENIDWFELLQNGHNTNHLTINLPHDGAITELPLSQQQQKRILLLLYNYPNRLIKHSISHPDFDCIFPGTWLKHREIILLPNVVICFELVRFLDTGLTDQTNIKIKDHHKQKSFDDLKLKKDRCYSLEGGMDSYHEMLYLGHEIF